MKLTRYTKLVATAGLAVTVLLMTEPSVAGNLNKRGTTFHGSCSLKGTVEFEPGATLVPQDLTYEFTGEGTCTGELNGGEVTDIAVAVHQHGSAEGSCVQARTTRPGVGELSFNGGPVLTYTLEFTYRVPETNFTWHGSRSGEARGTGTFRTDRTPPDTTARCATPTGATQVPMDITLTTETPLVGRKR